MSSTKASIPTFVGVRNSKAAAESGSRESFVPGSATRFVHNHVFDHLLCSEENTKMKMMATLGNPLLIFLYSMAILLLGCAIGLHWKGAPGAACWLAALGALLMVIHDLALGVFWFWAAATMFAKTQQRRS